MELKDVWSHLEPDVKRVFKLVAGEVNRIATGNLLGAILTVDSGTVSEIMSDIERSIDSDFIRPDSVTVESKECPEDIQLSPEVRETLRFFKMHHMRNVTVADLATRLLQISTGSLIREIEDAGLLESSIEALAQVSDR